MADRHSLRTNPVHLGLDARAISQPEFTGLEWYAAYAERSADDGREGRLVALHDFSESWTSWEMHPHGDEVVVCLSGAITLVQEMADGSHTQTPLCAGDCAIHPAGVWHTTDADGPASVLFITAGMGTQHRER